jgi:hypothetical protein
LAPRSMRQLGQEIYANLGDGMMQVFNTSGPAMDQRAMSRIDHMEWYRHLVGMIGASDATWKGPRVLSQGRISTRVFGGDFIRAPAQSLNDASTTRKVFHNCMTS